MNTTENRTYLLAGKGALICLSLAMLLASLGTSIANIALPEIARTFGAPFRQVQWVVIAYLAALTVFALIAGRLGDRFGRKRMLLAGLGLFSAGSALCGFAPSLGALVAARAAQGAGAAFLMTLTIALVRDTADEGRIGRAMGVIGTMSAIGTALGPSMGGVLIAALDWRAVFLALVPAGLAALALALRALPESRTVEAQQAMRPSALRGAGFAPNLASNLLVAAVMMTTLIVAPFYLGTALGLPAAAIGLVMSVGPVISILCGVPSGRLVDAWGTARVLSAGLVALAAGALMLALLAPVTGIAGYIAAIAILTPGYQLFQAANNTQTMTGARADQRGTVSGLLGLSRNLGLVTGAWAMGAVFAYGTGTAEVETAAPGSIADGMRMVFLLSAALMIAALALIRLPDPVVRDAV